MSYILDALRKADRERQGGRVPTIATAHAGPAPVRRPPWPWAVGGALALSAVVLALLWAAGRPDPVRQASVTAKSSTGAAALSPPPALDPPTSTSAGDSAPSGPPVEHASARAKPVPGGVQGAPTGGPPIGLEPAGSSARVAPVAPPAKTPRAARAADSPRSAPAPTGAPSSPKGPEAAPVAAAQPRATLPSEAPGGSAIAERRPPGTPAAPPAVVLAPGPLPDGGPGRAARPAPSDALARLTLDVLVYSEVPAERLVFINGRKYVEGQAVNGDAVLEQITPDGAILRHEDRRIVLRPKLNPYARPGSP